MKDKMGKPFLKATIIVVTLYWRSFKFYIYISTVHLTNIILAPLSNASVFDDSIRFVSSNKVKDKLKSSSSNNDEDESNEPDYNEYKDQLKEEQEQETKTELASNIRICRPYRPREIYRNMYSLRIDLCLR